MYPALCLLDLLRAQSHCAGGFSSEKKANMSAGRITFDTQKAFFLRSL